MGMGPRKTGRYQSCTVCKNKFWVYKHLHGKAFYCSRKCTGLAKNIAARIEVECLTCGEKFPTVKSNIANGRKHGKFCSRKCYSKRKLSSSVKNPDTVRYWLIRRGEMNKCERCGYNKHKEILIAHHKDRNRANNVRKNIEVLCPNCHALEHYGEKRKHLHSKSMYKTMENNDNIIVTKIATPSGRR